VKARGLEYRLFLDKYLVPDITLHHAETAEVDPPVPQRLPVERLFIMQRPAAATASGSLNTLP